MSNTSLDLDFTAMNPFELAARHTIAKEHKHYITCAKIEAVVEKLKGRDRWYIERLRFYQPIKTEINFKTIQNG